ncbi:MAG: hypothetical protein MN733_20320 [Nitrososphaera sp.]|nr:hypothetical protein [Nitrososphaera sp.]
MIVYARLCNIEILSSYIKDVSIGDMLTVQALITNPLDWQHFYEKISTIRMGEKTDFTVVTREGDRLVGSGDIVEVDKWSNRGQYGFKVKMRVRKQKSLTDRRIRGPGRPAKAPAAPAEKPSKVPAELPAQVVAATNAVTTITPQDMSAFRDMLKGSLTMDIAE